MKNQDDHKSITTEVSAEETFRRICSVSKWWTANFKGSAKNPNDIFILRFGENKFTKTSYPSCVNIQSARTATAMLGHSSDAVTKRHYQRGTQKAGPLRKKY